jgi:hypothetical protein
LTKRNSKEKWRERCLNRVPYTVVTPRPPANPTPHSRYFGGTHSRPLESVMRNGDGGWLSARRTPLCGRRRHPPPSRGDGDHATTSAGIRDGECDVEDDDDAAMTTTSPSSSSSSPPTTRAGVAIPPSLMPHLDWTRMSSSHSSRTDDRRRRRARRMRERRDDDEGGGDFGKEGGGGGGGGGGDIRTKVTGRAVVSFSSSFDAEYPFYFISRVNFLFYLSIPPSLFSRMNTCWPC